MGGMTALSWWAISTIVEAVAGRVGTAFFTRRGRPDKVFVPADGGAITCVAS